MEQRSETGEEEKEELTSVSAVLDGVASDLRLAARERDTVGPLGGSKTGGLVVAESALPELVAVGGRPSGRTDLVVGDDHARALVVVTLCA